MSVFDDAGVAAAYVDVRAGASVTDPAFEEALRKDVHVGDVLLDLGCGDARQVQYFVELGAHCVLAADASLRMALLGRDRSAAKGAQLIVGDAQALPFAAASIDIVVANYVLHYVDDVPATLREIARVLRPKVGRITAMASVVRAAPSFEWLYNTLFPLQLAGRFTVPTYAHSLAMLLEQFRGAGLDVLEATPIPNDMATVGPFKYASELTVSSVLIRCAFLDDRQS